ncbi:MAG TPA: hypothetical protein VGJ21_22255 [Terracidiphilus sp.]|jgi:hypothetical protein
MALMQAPDSGDLWPLDSSNHPSAAKAFQVLMDFSGTSKLMPFQNIDLPAGCRTTERRWVSGESIPHAIYSAMIRTDKEKQS